MSIPCVGLKEGDSSTAKERLLQRQCKNTKQRLCRLAVHQRHIGSPKKDIPKLPHKGGLQTTQTLRQYSM